MHRLQEIASEIFPMSPCKRGFHQFLLWLLMGQIPLTTFLSTMHRRFLCTVVC